MLAKIWKFLNAPIVILAIIVLAILFVIQPRVFVPGAPYEFEPAKAHEPRDTPSGTKDGFSYFSVNAGIGTHYGYFRGMQYASEVPADGVFNGPQWKPSSGSPPLGPGEAVTAVRAGLSDQIPEIADMPVEEVSIVRVASGYFIYIVEFNAQDETPSVGLRLVVLMDGTVVRPTVTPGDGRAR